jgi:hypothetical protein
MNDIEKIVIDGLDVLRTAKGKAEALLWQKKNGYHDYDIGAEIEPGNIVVIESRHFSRNGVCVYPLPKTTQHAAWCIRAVTALGNGPWSDRVLIKEPVVKKASRAVAPIPTPVLPAPEPLPPAPLPPPLPPAPIPPPPEPNLPEEKVEVPEHPKEPKPPRKALRDRISAWKEKKRSFLVATKALIIALVLVGICAVIFMSWDTIQTKIGEVCASAENKASGYWHHIFTKTPSATAKKQAGPGLQTSPILDTNTLQKAVAKKQTHPTLNDDPGWIPAPDTNYVDGSTVTYTIRNGESLKFKMRLHWAVVTDGMIDFDQYIDRRYAPSKIEDGQEFGKRVMLIYKNPTENPTNSVEIPLKFVNLLADRFK